MWYVLFGHLPDIINAARVGTTYRFKTNQPQAQTNARLAAAVTGYRMSTVVLIHKRCLLFAEPRSRATPYRQAKEQFPTLNLMLLGTGC